MARWLSRLSLRRTMSTSHHFIPEVDGFRFIAIFLVVISHIYKQCNLDSGSSPVLSFVHYAFRDGKVGVRLFFVISGFILAMPFAQSHLLRGKAVDLRRYLKRRLTRLEPPYLLAMLLRFPLVAGYKHVALGGLALHLLASLFYVHSLAYGTMPDINPPAWSLEVEVQFYLIAPLLSLVFLIRSPTGRRLLLVASILAGSLYSHSLEASSSSPRLALSLLNFSQYFLAGFLLCDTFLTRSHPRFAPLLWDLLGAASLLWILLSAGTLSHFLLPWAAILLYLAGFHGRLARSAFAHPAISLTGGMCYSIYLTHTLVLSVVSLLVSHLFRHPLSPWAGTVLTFSLALPLVLVVATLYYKAVEQPCMDPQWPRKLAARLRRGRSFLSLAPTA